MGELAEFLGASETWMVYLVLGGLVLAGLGVLFLIRRFLFFLFNVVLLLFGVLLVLAALLAIDRGAPELPAPSPAPSSAGSGMPEQ